MSSILVKDLKKGMTVFESEYGKDIKMEVVYDAYQDISLRDLKDGFSCLVENRFGRMTLFQDKTITHYGPRLYTEPQYGNVV